MPEISRQDGQTCSLKCKSQYHDCMQSREHESVCRMKFAQCNCGCSTD